jgi:CRP/FNR family transcriptional regulator
MAAEPQQELTQLLQRIPLFAGLAMQECRQVLAFCKRARYPSGKAIYAAGTPGKEMLVILKGKVTIQLPGGPTVAELEAIDTVGEVEICTGEPRIARVAAEGEVSGLTIGRIELESLIAQHHEVGVKILKNIIHSLSSKLATTNKLVSQRRPE